MQPRKKLKHYGNRWKEIKFKYVQSTYITFRLYRLPHLTNPLLVYFCIFNRREKDIAALCTAVTDGEQELGLYAGMSFCCADCELSKSKIEQQKSLEEQVASLKYLNTLICTFYASHHTSAPNIWSICGLIHVCMQHENIAMPLMSTKGSYGNLNTVWVVSACIVHETCVC